MQLSPLPSSKWDYAKAAHLLNRAGFGGTPQEIDKLVKMGPSKAVAHFVDYEKFTDYARPLDWAKPDPGRRERYQKIQELNRQQRLATTDAEKTDIDAKRRELQQVEQKDRFIQLQQLRGWWLERMATTPRPLQEKMTLFWHGHFATSAQKVNESYFMWRQIQTFREMACGNWPAMLEAVAKDPAMLIWLDQAQSRKEHPNENFARELMELFTLGEGHYTEKDVTEAARALTGWSLERIDEQFIYRPEFHDYGVKTVLGKSIFTGNDLLETIVAEPQSARFITGKLWKFFASETIEPQLLDALADSFRSNGNNFKPFLEKMFRSREFYSDTVMNSQVKSPVQWLVGSVRMLERNMPPPAVSGQMIRSLGQDLLAPPNVKGWDGGLTWITTNTLLGRYNEAEILVMGQGNLGAEGQGPGMKMLAERANEMSRNLRPADVEKMITAEDRHDPEKVINILGKWFLQSRFSDKHHQVLAEYFKTRPQLEDEDIRHATRLLMSTPEYQIT